MSTKPTAREEMEKFAAKLTDESPDHEAWLSIVRYGMGTLLENQPLLIEIIVREATKQNKALQVAEGTRRIFEELGLRLEVCQ